MEKRGPSHPDADAHRGSCHGDRHAGPSNKLKTGPRPRSPRRDSDRRAHPAPSSTRTARRGAAECPPARAADCQPQRGGSRASHSSTEGPEAAPRSQARGKQIPRAIVHVQNPKYAKRTACEAETASQACQGRLAEATGVAAGKGWAGGPGPAGEAITGWTRHAAQTAALDLLRRERTCACTAKPPCCRDKNSVDQLRFRQNQSARHCSSDTRHRVGGPGVCPQSPWHRTRSAWSQVGRGRRGPHPLGLPTAGAAETLGTSGNREGSGRLMGEGGRAQPAQGAPVGQALVG